MKKLRIFIVISIILPAAYAFSSDLIKVNNFCVDFDYSRQIKRGTVKNKISDIPSLISDFFGHLCIPVDAEIADIQSDSSDVDIEDTEESQDPKMKNHGMTLMLSAIQDAPVLEVRCPSVALFHFPLKAYRLRI